MSAKVLTYWDAVECNVGNFEPTITQQHFADECNINKIMERYEMTGILPAVEGTMQYGDFSAIGDYQSALDQVLQAQNSFMQLPPDIRYRFDNNPGKLIAFLEDEKNRDEAIKLGLVEDPVKEVPPKVGDPMPVKPATPIVT